MMKKLMSLGLVGILSVSLMVGCSSNDSKDDDTVTIKYVDEQGNVKQEKVTKERAQQIENNQKQQTNDTTKKEQTTKEQPKDEDEMTEDEMYEKGLIKKHGGHLEEEAKEQEKIHEQEDQEQQGKYPIVYDDDGTQINDEYGNYTPEYDHKKEEQQKHQQFYDEDDDYPGKGILDPEDTTNTDSNVEETPSEPAQ